MSKPAPETCTFSSKEIDCKPNRRISFDENVHVFDMSKPAPESPKKSKVITPILKQSPNVSSDEETEYLVPTKKHTVPQRSTVPQRPTVPQEDTVPQSRNTG